VRQHINLINSLPELRGLLLDVMQQRTETLAAALAAESGAPPDDLHSHLLAGLLVSAVNKVARDYLVAGTVRDLEARCQEVIDYAVSHFTSD
jgi:hypothetical protein